MKIRRATIDDSPALAHIQVDSYRTAYATFFPQTYLDHFSYEEETQDWRNILTSAHNEVLFVAEDEQNKIVGYALGKINPDPKGQFDCSLTAIHVHPSRYRQGIGRQLLVAVVKALQAHGCRALWLSTLPGNSAQTWYERLGGVPIGEERYTVDEREIVEIKYGWSDIAVLLQYADRQN